MSSETDDDNPLVADNEPQPPMLPIENVDTILLPGSHITARVIERLTYLYDHTDWRVVLLDGIVDRSYGEMLTSSICKALMLPFLVNIPNERELGRVIRDVKSIRELCGFDSAHLPGERTLWHFRKKYSKVYDLLILRALVALVLDGKEPNIDLPFVMQATDEIIPLDSHRFTIELDHYRPPIEVTTQATVIYKQDANEVAYSSDPEYIEFTQKWSELLRSTGLAEYSKKAKAYKREWEHLISRGSMPIFSGRSLLPAWIETRLYSGQEVSFGIRTPDWISPRGEFQPHLDLLDDGSTPRRPFDKACNILVFRTPERRELLLSRRMDKGYGVNTYALPGGKQRPDETLEACARRELKEETNLDMIASVPVSMFYTRSIRYGTVMSVGVLAIEYRGEIATIEPEHHAGWSWYDINDLPSPLFEPTRIAVSQFLEKKYSNLDWQDVEQQGPRQLGLFRGSPDA